MKVHPVAEAFPPISGMASAELVKSIKEHGLIHPIVVLDGFIIDGRCRYDACKAAKVKPKTVQYEGETDTESLIAYVDAVNDKRRHLTPSQRAVAAVKLSRISRAESANLRPAMSSAAKHLGISDRSVDIAAKVVREAPPAITKAVESGEVKVSDAAAIVDLPKKAQAAALKKVQRGEAKTLKQAAADFDPVALEAKSKRASGKEVRKPADRKEALAAFGKLVRALDRMKISADLDGELKKILAAIKAA